MVVGPIMSSVRAEGRNIYLAKTFFSPSHLVVQEIQSTVLPGTAWREKQWSRWLLPIKRWLKKFNNEIQRQQGQTYEQYILLQMNQLICDGHYFQSHHVQMKSVKMSSGKMLSLVKDAKVFVEPLSCPPLRLSDVKCIAAYTGIFINGIRLQLER